MIEQTATAIAIEQAKISDILRAVIRRRANEEGGISKFARKVGVNAHRFYNQMNRGNGVLAEVIVLSALGGLDEPLRIVADKAGFDVTPKSKFLRRAHPPAKPIRSYALDLHHACSKVTLMIEEALKDGQIDERELLQVQSAIQQLRNEMAELEAKVGGAGGK